jgi:hypothetical protein
MLGGVESGVNVGEQRAVAARLLSESAFDVSQLGGRFLRFAIVVFVRGGRSELKYCGNALQELGVRLQQQADPFRDLALFAGPDVDAGEDGQQRANRVVGESEGDVGWSQRGVGIGE